MSTQRPTSTAAALELRADQDGTVATVIVAGEVDASNAGRLRAAARALSACGVTDLVIDCEGLTFLDSAGLSVLVELAGRAAEVGGSLTLEHVAPLVRRVLSITAVDTVLTLRPGPTTDPSGTYP